MVAADIATSSSSASRPSPTAATTRARWADLLPAHGGQGGQGADRHGEGQVLQEERGLRDDVPGRGEREAVPAVVDLMRPREYRGPLRDADKPGRDAPASWARSWCSPAV